MCDGLLNIGNWDMQDGQQLEPANVYRRPVQRHGPCKWHDPLRATGANGDRYQSVLRDWLFAKKG